MKTMLFLVMAVAVFTARTACAHAQVITGTTKGDLESNLSLLNLFGEQPETVKQLYAAAYAVLAADPRATFADVAKDLEVRRLCDENGITHFGGPMLGAVAADGEVAGVLGVDAGSPLLSVERLSFTYGDKPVELRRGFYDTSTHHYRNELN